MNLHHSNSLLITEFMLFTLTETVWALTLGFTLWAGWVDWRTRRIPNWLTVSGFFAGMAVNTILGGWRGAVASLEGAGLALGILLPLVLLRGVGAGDWKLMGAIGALMGWRPMLFVLLVSFLVSGVMAVIQMIVTRRVKQTLGNTFALAKGLTTFGLRMKANITLDNPTLMRVPFGAAVAAATVFSFVFVYWPR